MVVDQINKKLSYMNREFKYGIDKLTVKKALEISRASVQGIITDEVKDRIVKNFNAVQSIVKGDKMVYSINTGFGSLCTTVGSKQ